MRMPLTDDMIRHAAQMYADAYVAAGALGIAHRTFLRYCRQYGIPAPRPPARNAARVSRLRAAADRMDMDTATAYLNRCATPGCAGHPLADGYCIRCAARQVHAA